MKEADVGGIEDRRFERYDVDCRVKIIRRPLGNTTIHFGRASNISAGGIMLVAPVDLQNGETIGLEFNLPHMTEVIQLQAVVRHRLGDYSFGVEFREMTDRIRQSIVRMCETLSVL